MISTVVAKSFHIYILHYLLLKLQGTDKTCIRLSRLRKHVLKNITDLPKVIQEVAELRLKPSFSSQARPFN